MITVGVVKTEKVAVIMTITTLIITVRVMNPTKVASVEASNRQQQRYIYLY